MRSARISFINKKVWIIGGGKQALIRGKQFIEEGAQVIFLAPCFRNELLEFMEEHNIAYMRQSYEKGCIEECFLVYACTDNREVNHGIVIEANANGMLSASVHKDEEASYHPLKFADYEHMHVAVSTNGADPAYNKVLLEDIERLYQEKHHTKLKELRSVREERIT